MGDGDSGRDEGDVLGIDKRKAVVTVVVAIVLGGGAVAAIGAVASFHELLRAVRTADVRWFPLCAFGEALAYLGYILAYRDLARVDDGPELDYRTCTRVVATGFGAHVVGSSAGGLAVDFWALHRAGADVHEAARRVLALNTLEWGVLSVFAALSSVAVLAGRGHGAPPALTLAWLVAVPCCLLAALWVSSPRRADRVTSAPESGERPGWREGRALAGWLFAKLRKGLADAIGGVVLVRRLLARPLRYPAGVVGYPIYWLGDILTLYAALRAFGTHVDPAPLVLAYATGYVVTALPLPAGGAGGVEASLSLMLHLVGVPLAPAVLAALVYRIFNFWLPILPALAFLPGLRGLAEELPQTEREYEGEDRERAAART